MDRVLFKAMLYNLITLKMYVLMPIFKSGNLGFLSDHLSFWHLKKNRLNNAKHLQLMLS